MAADERSEAVPVPLTESELEYLKACFMERHATYDEEIEISLKHKVEDALEAVKKVVSR
jgi:hypothetical protein